MTEILRTAFLVIYSTLISILPMPIYKEGLVGQPESFNPLKLSSNQIDRDISSLLYRGILKYDLAGELVPDLAESFSISENGKEYTVKLKKDIHWHDGKKITANDILYTVSKSPKLSGIAVDKLDDLSVKFKLAEPLAPFLDILTIQLVPAHLPDKLSDLKPIGSGNYRIKEIKKTQRVEKVVLQGSSKRLEFRFYNNLSDLEKAAKLGEIDSFLTESTRVNKNLSNFNYYSLPVKNRYFAIFLNQADKTLKDGDLRRNLALSTPKVKLNKDVFNENVEIVEGPVDGTPYESPLYKRYKYTESISDKYSLSLKLIIPEKEEHFNTAVLIKEAWSKIGVNLEIVPMDSDKIIAEIIPSKSFQLLLLGQEVQRDPDRYTLWDSTQKDLPGLNFISLKQIRIDRSLEEGRVEMDVKKRMEHYRHFQEAFAEDVPAIFLYRPVATYAVKKKVATSGLKSVFFLKDRFADFENWKFN